MLQLKQKLIAGLVMLVLLSALKVQAETVINIKPEEDLQAAIEKSRTQAHPVKIILQEGTYFLSKPLKLTSADHDLVISGEGVVTVTCKTPVPGFKLIDQQKNIWQAKIPETINPEIFLHQLWTENETLSIARDPDDTLWETQQQLSSKAPVVMNLPLKPNPAWVTQGNVQLVCVQKWAGFRFPIKQIDEKNSTIELQFAAIPHRQENKNRFWIENSPEAMNQPGEWYWDANTRMIYLIPHPDKNPETTPYYLPSSMQFINLNGSQRVRIEKLYFAGCADDFPLKGEIDPQAASSRRGAIQFNNCEECAITDCRISQAGGYGIDIGGSSTRCKITHCRLEHLGAGGIRIGETQHPAAGARENSHHLVTNNIIEHYGEYFYGGCGLIIFQSAHNQIVQNNIHDGQYTGISVGWTWGYRDSPCHHNLIAYNHLHHLGSILLSDMGGIYLLGPQPGTVVRGNYIHDITCHDYGAWGLYTDEGSTNMLLEENMVCNTQKAGFHQHYGKENIVRNNVFYNTGEGGVRRTREEDHLSFTFEQNIVYSDQDPAFLNNSYRNGHFKFDKNLYYSPNVSHVSFFKKSWEEWQKSGNDRESVVADPLFIDPHHPELGLSNQSPALKLNIKPVVIQTDPQTGILKVTP